MVGASRTSPVPGNGIRRRHARRRILPSFRALRGDNTPTAALRGLRMITMAKCVQGCSLSCFLEVREGKASSLLPLCSGLVLMDSNPLHGCPGGLYRPTPQGYNGNPAGRGSQPSVSMLAGFSAGHWGPPTGGSRRLPASCLTCRPHRLGALSAAGYCCLASDDEGLVEVSVATVPPPCGLSL